MQKVAVGHEMPWSVFCASRAFGLTVQLSPWGVCWALSVWPVASTASQKVGVAQDTVVIEVLPSTSEPADHVTPSELVKAMPALFTATHRVATGPAVAEHDTEVKACPNAPVGWTGLPHPEPL